MKQALLKIRTKTKTSFEKELPSASPVKEHMLEKMICENTRFKAIKSQHMAKRRNLEQFMKNEDPTQESVFVRSTRVSEQITPMATARQSGQLVQEQTKLNLKDLKGKLSVMSNNIPKSSLQSKRGNADLTKREMEKT